MEQRGDPQKPGGSVAGAGGCGSGEARQEEQFPKKDTEQKDTSDERRRLFETLSRPLLLPPGGDSTTKAGKKREEPVRDFNSSRTSSAC